MTGIAPDFRHVNSRKACAEEPREGRWDERFAVQLDVLGNAERREQHELLVDHAYAGRERVAGRKEPDRFSSEEYLTLISPG